MIPEAEELNASLTVEEQKYLDAYAEKRLRERIAKRLATKGIDYINSLPPDKWPPRLPPVDVGRYVHIWSRLVERAEVGYPWPNTLEEYINDLCYRSNIEEFLLQGPPSLADKLQRLLEPLDARFRVATIEIANPLYGYETPGRDAWWFRRVPVSPKEPLRKQLIELGYWPPGLSHSI